MPTYWRSFALGCVVLPMMRTSLQSGYFTLGACWMDAFWSSVKTWLGLSGLVFVAMLLLAVELRNFLVNILPLLMAIGSM
jgi:hypothetical protein